MMPGSVMKQVTIAFFFLDVGAFAQTAASTTANPVVDKVVAEKALQIVSDIHGSWTQMPGNIATARMTSGALIGNGSVGVAIGGTPEQQEYYVGREDFWSVQRGKIMPVGRLRLTIPALKNATTQLQENIGPADVTASFAAETSKLKSHSWVDSSKNFFFVEMENPSAASLEVTAQMLDAFGQDDLETLGGKTGQVYWRRISPELVHATIGGPNDGKGLPLDARVRSLKIFDDSQTRRPAGSEKPIYAWESPSGLSSGSGAKGAQTFSCGDIILPERKFTVRASIYADHANAEGILFSSISQHWQMQQQDPTNPLGNVRGHDIGRPQGAEAGLLIYILRGRLAANLNGTVVTASESIPLQQWADVAVTYDGIKMTLLVNGRPVARTSDFPTAAQVMGPEWEWAATHPGDTQVPFDGVAPEGVLAVRIMGAQVSAEKGELRFQIPAGGEVIVAVAATDDRDATGYFQSAIAELQRATAETVAQAWSRHVGW